MSLSNDDQPVSDGSLKPHDILRINGETALQNYLVQDVKTSSSGS